REGHDGLDRSDRGRPRAESRAPGARQGAERGGRFLRLPERSLAGAGRSGRQRRPGEVPGEARRRPPPSRPARDGSPRGAQAPGGARRAADRQGGPPRRPRTQGRFPPPKGLRRDAPGARRGPRGAFDMTDLFPIGEVPKNVGEVPKRMLAWCIRPDREGDPLTAMKLEEVDVPPVGPNEALVLVMGAGVNFNGVWAARG